MEGKNEEWGEGRKERKRGRKHERENEDNGKECIRAYEISSLFFILFFISLFVLLLLPMRVSTFF